MSVRTETLQLRVVIDGSPARRELAGLDQEYAKLNAGLKDLKKNTAEYTAATQRMETIRQRQAELRKEIGLTGLTAKQLGDELRRLQVAQRNLTPNTQLWAENAQRIEQVKQRLRELNDVNARTAAAWAVQRQAMRLTDMSMEQLELEARRLREALRTMDPNTAIFANTRRELAQVEQRSREVGRTAGGVFQRTGMELRAMATSYVGIGAAIYGAVRGVGTFIRWNAELSDQLADVRKTTNLSQEAVERLSLELGRLNTRSSREELLALARDAGKLGITAEEDVLRFVRAADQINVALSEDLGDDAVRTIGKLSDQFKLTSRDGFDLERSMLGIGSVLNVLGMASTASEGFIVDFTSRLAGAGTQAGLTLEQVMGLAATLDQLGQRSETSSTAVGRFLIEAFNNTATYARIAGMEVGQFSELLRTDANQALLLTLKGLNGNGEGLARMTALFGDLGQEGARAVQVLATLASNTGTLEEQQRLANEAMAEGSSVSDEAAQKNSTLAAELEKLRNGWNNFVTDLDQGSGIFSRALQGTARVLTQVLGYFREINREADLLGRDIAIGTDGSMMRDERSAAAFRAELERIVELNAEEAGWRDKSLASTLALRNVSDNEIRAMRDTMRVTVDRLKTVEEIAAAEDSVRAKLAGTEQASLKQARLQLLLAQLAQRRLTVEEQIQQAAQGGEPGAEGDGGTGAPAPGDGGAEAAAEKRRQQMETMLQELLDHRERMYQAELSADERDLRLLDVKHAKELAKLKENALATEADLLALEGQQAQERADLIAAQGEERLQGYSAAAERIRQAMLSASAQELEDEMQRWDELITLGQAYGMDTAALEEARQQALDAIRAKWREKELSDDELQSRKLRDQRVQHLQALISTQQSVGSMLGGLNQMLQGFFQETEERSWEHTAQARILAILQMKIATAVAITEAVRSIIKDPSAPWFVKMGAIAGAAGQVMGAVGAAWRILGSTGNVQRPSQSGAQGAGAQPPSNMPTGAKGGIFEGPSHARGGLQVWDPVAGRQVAEVEGEEPWMVLSKLFRRNNADLIPLLLEASATGARLPIGARGGVFGRMPRFNFTDAQAALGGSTSTYTLTKKRTGRMVNPDDGLNGSFTLAEKALGGGSGSASPDKVGDAPHPNELSGPMGGVLRELRALRETVALWPGTVRAVASLQDLNRRQAELSELEDRNRAGSSAV